jgi:CSLREA domain-containing protein
MIRFFRMFLLLMLLAVALSPTPGAAQQPPTLVVDHPARVEVGAQILVTLTLRGAQNFGGYETTLRYDGGAAHFNGLEHLLEPVRRAGRGVGQLGAVEREDSLVFGAYSCPVAECPGGRDGPRQKVGAGGDLPLATVALIADAPGTLELALGDTVVVDADGGRLALAGGAQTIRVEVGAAAPLHAAPAGAAEKSVATLGPPGALDLTGDGRVTYADAAEAALAWTFANESGAPCGASIDITMDVDGDGCVAIGDVQRVVAAYSPPGSPAAPTTKAGAITVTSAADDPDASIGDGVCASARGACTLRAAIAEANLAPGADTILFNITGGGPHTIALTRPLPTLNDESGPTTIDGYSQPGAAPNDDPLVSNAVIKVQIAPAASVAEGTIEGLPITSGGNTIRGVAMYRFRRALMLFGAAADRNVIAGSFVGTDAAGSYAAPAAADSGNGIELAQGASDNRIGGSAPEDRNVISGNPKHGVATFNGGTDRNVIAGNLIGLSPAGDRRVPNFSFGVDINSHSSNNIIGGESAAERNVISGNGGEGVEVSHGQRTVGNRIVGNFIGTDVTGARGTAFSYNNWNGVHIEDGPVGTVVTGNVIGNNRGGGVNIDGFDTGYYPTGNQVYGNWIGVSQDGTPIANGKYGVQLDDHTYQTRIGPDNVIAHNPVGIQILGDDTDFNTITRNRIFGNTGLGIDIAPLGAVNQNDPGDADAGPNQQLNFPELDLATTEVVRGTACAGCTVELFRASGGAGSHAQGERFVGSAQAGSDGAFMVVMAAVEAIAAGDYVTATATDAEGNTSEFAPGRVVTPNLVVTPVTPPPAEEAGETNYLYLPGVWR